MDTRNLKDFAQQARKLIKEGVKFELQKKGFNSDGSVAFEPTKISGGTLFDGELYDEHFYDQWMALKDRIIRKGLDNVFEETAYTWFNRLIALQILSKNNIISVPVLEFADATRRVPQIVEEARNGRWENIDEESQKKVQVIINDYSKVQEQFTILVSSYCRNTPLINKCFGGIADYTEILLPSNILAADNFICLLNNTPFITDEDYHTTELLGWLYQFYISEKKDEVNKRTEWSADDVPAGTQIFTPNWIVKYMVENTLGRIYLDHDSYASFKDKLKYLVEPCEGERPIYEFENLKDLRCADFSCGSGHILNEFFDLLLKCYEEEGMSATSAIENIFRYNLVGIDLDTRAKQLSMFSLLLKACQKEKNAFVDAHIMPRVLDMPVPVSMNDSKLKAACLKFIGGYENVVGEELESCFELLKDANELGSIMKFELDDNSVAMIRAHYDDWTDGGTDDCPEDIKALLPGVNLILALSEKYSAICMNPPYMGRKHMDTCLANYTKNNYPNSCDDLFSVFMDVAIDRLQEKAKYGMINMQSWMFLPTFKSIREDIISNYLIESLIHLGKNTFEELNGEVVNSTCFVIVNSNMTDLSLTSNYFKLTQFKTCVDKEIAFINKENNFKVSQVKFKNINGSPLGYWLSDSILSLFDKQDYMAKYGKAYQGLATADNDRFTRFWYEVSIKSIGFDMGSTEEAARSEKKWFPYNNGGKGRRWYGCHTDIVNWENDGYEIKAFKDENGKQKSRPQNTSVYFKEVISWNMITLSGLYFRYFPKGFIFSNASNSFPCSDVLGTIGFLNSKFTPQLLELISPGTNMSNGVLSKFPNMVIKDVKFQNNVSNCIEISKQDWDAHETSWNFKGNELVRLFRQNGGTIEQSMDTFIAEWTKKFYELHDNEEELNRQFISIYGLQDELTPDVPLNEVTILQQKEINIDNGQLKWNKDVILKQLISYAIGCMMGRYRLDRPGLHIAHPNATDEEKVDYLYNGELFSIDDDAIIPLLPRDCPFNDNAIIRLENFVRQVFGEDNFKDNWNYITSVLGDTEGYLTKPTGFWKDHRAMYQNTPIYWLFSSKKGAFKCLVYMHRMNQFTAREVREKYLLKYIEFLRNMIKPLEAEEASLGRADKKRLESYKKALEECEEYDLRLHEVAQKFIAFDLDDGVKMNYAKFGDVLANI